MNLSYLARTVKLPPYPYCKAGYLVYKDKGIVIMKTAPCKRFYCVAYKVSVNALLIPYIPDDKNRETVILQPGAGLFYNTFVRLNELRIVHV